MLAGLLLALLLFVDGQADPQKAGLQALDAGKFQEAAQIFLKLTADDPQDYAAFFNLALAETSLHQDEQAVAHFQKTLKLKPKLFEAELNLGVLLQRNQRNAEAVPLLQEAVSERPKDVRPRQHLAEALAGKNDFAGAAAVYEQLLQMDAKNANAELGLGQSLQRQDKLDEAAPHYKKAAALEPQLQSYLLELAGAFTKENRPTDAIALLKEMPAEPALQEELGRLYLSSGQADLAVQSFQAAVSQSPTAANQMALATAYLKNNQEALAAPILEKALAESPQDYELRMVVGRIRRDRHDYSSAAAQFVTAAGIKPDAVEAWNEAATAYVLSEQYVQAIAALDKVHGLNADTAGSFYYRAICLDKLHQLKPAIVSYRKFLELSSGKFPDLEFNARQRSKTLEHEVNR